MLTNPIRQSLLDLAETLNLKPLPDEQPPVDSATWNTFQTWCDFIHVNCDQNDPEISSYDREI